MQNLRVRRIKKRNVNENTRFNENEKRKKNTCYKKIWAKIWPTDGRQSVNTTRHLAGNFPIFSQNISSVFERFRPFSEDASHSGWFRLIKDSSF